jgi:hypothetical protein
MELNEMECKIVDWIHLAQERHQRQNVVKVDINIQIPEKQKMFLPSLGTINVSRKAMFLWR